MVESLALGEPVDVHQVMLALGEASNALHLTLQVRGKVLEAYQELCGCRSESALVGVQAFGVSAFGPTPNA